jgi:hypothetical protein
MPTTPYTIVGTIREHSPATVLARVYGLAGTAITQASLSAIACSVYDLDSATPNTAVATPTVTIVSSVFDTLQTGGAWDKDSTGYNFSHTIGKAVFTSGGHRYKAEYKFTPTSGDSWRGIEADIYVEPQRMADA